MNRLAVLVLSVFLVATSAAHAYVPPSGYMIEQLAKRHRSLKGLRVKTRITGTSTQIKEIAWYEAPTRTLKARILDANDHEIYAYQRKITPQDSLASLVLFESNAETIMKGLLAAGIPVVPKEEILKLQTEEERRALELTAIGRLDKRVGWTIGQGSPSFWILKDEFTPLKLALNGGVEIRFEETKTMRDFPYSRAISLYRSGDFVLKGEAIEVMVNPDLSDMKSITVTGAPAIPSSLDSATRSLIEQWVQWIR